MVALKYEWVSLKSLIVTSGISSNSQLEGRTETLLAACVFHIGMSMYVMMSPSAAASAVVIM